MGAGERQRCGPMIVLNRRAFIAVTAAGVVAPIVGAAKEEESSRMDWMTMSLEARNLAFNNVAHVGPEFARQKTEGWAAASKALRAQRPNHLDLAYAQAERTKWDLYPATDPTAPCYVHIHGGYWQRGSKDIFACMAEGVLARGWSAALPGYTLAPDGDHKGTAHRARLVRRAGRRARYCGTRHTLWLVGRWASHGILAGSSTSGGRAGDFWRIRTCSAARLPPRQR